MMLQLRVNILFLSCCWLVSFSVLTGYNGTIFAYGQVHEHRPTNITVIVKNSSPHRQSADCWLSVGRLLVICRPTAGDLSADCWPTVGQLSTNTLPTVDRQIYLDFSEKITSCRTSVGHSRPTVGDLSVRCWQSFGRMSLTSCRLLPWFTTLDNCIEKIKWNSQ